MFSSRFVSDHFLVVESYDLRDPEDSEMFIRRASAALVSDAEPHQAPELLAAQLRRKRRVSGHLGFVAADRYSRHDVVCGYGVSSRRLPRSSATSHVHLDGMRVADSYRDDYVGAVLLGAMVGPHCLSNEPVIDPSDFVGRMQQRLHEDPAAPPTVPAPGEQNDPSGMTVLDVRRAIAEAYPLLGQINLAYM